MASKPRRRRSKPNDVSGDTLPINKDFAERYDISKRRELLRNAPAAVLDPSADASSPASSSSSEEEDDFGHLLTRGIDRRVRATLEAIRTKDPRIYDADTRFFEPAPETNGDQSDEDAPDNSDKDEGSVNSDDEPVAGWDTIAKAADQNAPKLTIKDYVRESLLKHGNLSDGDDDDGDQDEQPDYDHEAEHHHNTTKKTSPSFKDSGKDENNDADDEDGDDDGDDDDNFFTVKEKSKEDLEKEEEDLQLFLTKTAKKRSKQAGEDLLLHSYLQNETPDAKERFLRDFVLNNGWLDKNATVAPNADDYNIEVDLPQGADDDEDSKEDEEEFLDRVDEFEAGYNFRFEEPGSSVITSHARTVGDSMRRPDERRRNARLAQRERKKKQKAEKLKELGMLKKAKRREIQTRLIAIKDAAGEDVDLDGLDLDGDFDPEAFNRQMEERFGDDYYSKDDKTMESVGEEGATATEGRQKEGEHVPEDVREDVNRMIDEYYNLNYEDIVGGEAVRFKYKKVEPESFNLSAGQILSMEDKELNRLVSIKKLAPYMANRDVQKQAWRVRRELQKRSREAAKLEVEEEVEGADGEAEERKQRDKKKKRKKKRRGNEHEAEA